MEENKNVVTTNEETTTTTVVETKKSFSQRHPHLTKAAQTAGVLIIGFGAGVLAKSLGGNNGEPLATIESVTTDEE